ncbi:MAG: DEAD/DEAH box helicase [Pirellula sp.]|nr:DEAD/DEAH box helicase [Pirellula sp.]
MLKPMGSMVEGSYTPEVDVDASDIVNSYFADATDDAQASEAPASEVPAYVTERELKKKLKREKRRLEKAKLNGDNHKDKQAQRQSLLGAVETLNSQPNTDAPSQLTIESVAAETTSMVATQSNSLSHADPSEAISDELETSEEPVVLDESNSFKHLGIWDAVCQTLADSGYTKPTPIQSSTIPALLAGRDVLGQSNTGSGKTAAFALPLLQRVDVELKKTQVLVLTPTRELAMQVAASFESYGKSRRGLNVAAVYGGSGYSDQIQQLRRGAQIVVGTPGRVMDHMREGRMDLSSCSAFVLDEADEMLRMGFVDDVRWVLQQTPDNMQFALFSATMPDAIREIADQYLKDPHVVSFSQENRTAATIRQRAIVVEGRAKSKCLQRILESEETDGVIVFVKTRAATLEITEQLVEHGIRAAAINGDMAQAAREKCIDQLKRGLIQVLVATDVAARGLDVPRITHVINYDLPFDTEAYVHRIGRTGRAGRKGEAILFVTPKQRSFLREIYRNLNATVETMDMPTVDEINQQRKSRLKSQILNRLEQLRSASHGTLSATQNALKCIVEQCLVDSEASPIEIATVLATMQFDGRPFLLEADPYESDRRGRSRREDFGDNRRGNFDEDRGPRRSRGTRDREPLEVTGDFLEMFRVEVGRAHGVKPGNLVGAIANEIGLDSSRIGQITIHNEFSTVYLPAGMSRDVFKVLGRAWVVGRQLRISKWKDHPSAREDSRREPSDDRGEPRSRQSRKRPERRGRGFSGSFSGS